MKSITIHNLEPELEAGIVAEAQRYNLSLNKTIKKLLSESTGLSLKKKNIKRVDFSDLAGVWTKKEFEEFEVNTKIFEQIDKEDWE